MKLKKWMAACAILGFATAAHAQSAGSFILSMGWLHFMPRDSSEPLRINNYKGNPGEIVVPGSGASISKSNSLGITANYFITDNIATELVLGLPPKFKISGTGSLQPYGKIGEVKQLSPTLLLKYYFLDAQAPLRPYLGVGVSRVWFKDARITSPDFERKLGHESVSISVKNQWSAVFNAGVSYRFNERWFAGLSVSYMPLSTDATIRNFYHNKEGVRVPVTAKTSVKVNPIITYLNIGYRF